MSLLFLFHLIVDIFSKKIAVFKTFHLLLRKRNILKDEFNLDAEFLNFEQLRAAVVHAIMVYNTKRTHWSLGLLTPEEMYEQAA